MEFLKNTDFLEVSVFVLIKFDILNDLKTSQNIKKHLWKEKLSKLMTAQLQFI